MVTLIYVSMGHLVSSLWLRYIVSDPSAGVLYMLAVSSLATYSILLAGRSANPNMHF